MRLALIFLLTACTDPHTLAEAHKWQSWCRSNGGTVAWEQTSNVVHDMRCKINGITVEPYER